MTNYLAFSKALLLFGFFGSSFAVSIVLKQPTDANGNPVTDPIILSQLPPSQTNPDSPDATVITLPVTLPCIKVPLTLFNQVGSPLYNKQNGDPIMGPMGKQLRDGRGILVFGPKGGQPLFGEFAIPRCQEPELPKEVRSSQFGIFSGFFDKLCGMTKRLPVSTMPSDLFNYLQGFDYDPNDKKKLPSNEAELKLEYWYNRVSAHVCDDRLFWKQGPIKFVTSWDISMNDELNASPKSTLGGLFSAFSFGSSFARSDPTPNAPPELQPVGLASIQRMHCVDDLAIRTGQVPPPAEPSQRFVAKRPTVTAPMSLSTPSAATCSTRACVRWLGAGV